MFVLSLASVLLALRMTSQGAFHVSELTGQAISVTMRISLLIKTIQPDQSNPVVYMKGMVFNQKLLEKAYFVPKMTGLAMIWPASSDF